MQGCYCIHQLLLNTEREGGGLEWINIGGECHGNYVVFCSRSFVFDTSLRLSFVNNDRNRRFVLIKHSWELLPFCCTLSYSRVTLIVPACQPGLEGMENLRGNLRKFSEFWEETFQNEVSLGGSSTKKGYPAADPHQYHFCCIPSPAELSQRTQFDMSKQLIVINRRFRHHHCHWCCYHVWNGKDIPPELRSFCCDIKICSDLRTFWET